MYLGDGHWGTEGAGILLVRSDGQVLLTLRSHEVADPGVWGIPGGKVEPGEEPILAAVREAEEELGPLPPVNVAAWDVWRSPDGFRYTSFIAEIEERAARGWKPILNWEHDDWGWFDPKKPPRPVHPNVRRVLKKLVAS